MEKLEVMQSHNSNNLKESIIENEDQNKVVSVVQITKGEIQNR